MITLVGYSPPGFSRYAVVREFPALYRQGRGDGVWRQVAAWGEPKRVTLYRLGERWRPYLHTLVARAKDEDWQAVKVQIESIP